MTRDALGIMRSICFETLMPLIIKLEKSYQELKKDDEFWKEYEDLLSTGRPSPM